MCNHNKFVNTYLFKRCISFKICDKNKTKPKLALVPTDIKIVKKNLFKKCYKNYLNE